MTSCHDITCESILTTKKVSCNFIVSPLLIFNFSTVAAVWTVPPLEPRSAFTPLRIPYLSTFLWSHLDGRVLLCRCQCSLGRQAEKSLKWLLTLIPIWWCEAKSKSESLRTSDKVFWHKIATPLWPLWFYGTQNLWLAHIGGVYPMHGTLHEQRWVDLVCSLVAIVPGCNKYLRYLERILKMVS